VAGPEIRRSRGRRRGGVYRRPGAVGEGLRGALGDLESARGHMSKRFTAAGEREGTTRGKGKGKTGRPRQAAALAAWHKGRGGTRSSTSSAGHCAVTLCQCRPSAVQTVAERGVALRQWLLTHILLASAA